MINQNYAAAPCAFPFFRQHNGSRYISSENELTHRSNGNIKTVARKAPAVILSTLMQDKQITVLLADDDQDDRDLFAEAISELNEKIELSLVKNGMQLMEFLNKKEELPDVIFLDLNMPVKDGKECLKEIRSNKNFKDIPVVIYTTTNSLRDIDETYSLGANLFVRKPTSFKDVVQLARKIFMLNWEEYKPNLSKKNYVLNLK